MMAFRALLIDAYRQLSAAKLFWLTLGLSVLVVVLFGSIGFNDKGMSIFFGLTQIENDMFTSGSVWSRGLYIGIYSNFLVTVWLAWIATVLALISTCTIFPEFVRGGSIEMSLSKPVSRLQLFFMKYVVSLLFVLLQVTVFCVGIFFCVGLRLGEWNWNLFAAVPIVLVFYSYLFSVNVFVGVLTRSSITALLLTVIFWMGLWSSQTAETVLNQFVTQQEVKIDSFEEGIIEDEVELLALVERSPDDFRIERKRERINSMKEDVREARESFDQIEAWHRPTKWVLTVLPKTGQTIGLLDRWMSDNSGFDIAAIMRGEMDVFENMEEIDVTTHGARKRETMRRLQEDYRGRSLWYVVGTSLLFEGFILAIAAWIFVRRDY
jgi:ABC-type transport system involved in multi-copper enzyme maturation permease subunit